MALEGSIVRAGNCLLFDATYIMIYVVSHGAPVRNAMHVVVIIVTSSLA